MMPRNVANSGIAITLLRSVMIAVPIPMPNSATPIGRPIASTEPNATIRMMIANASPSTSEDGCSNSAKTKPPSSIRNPGMSGLSARIRSRISPARVRSMSSGISMFA